MTEREEAASELLSQPEIIAWLGLSEPELVAWLTLPQSDEDDDEASRARF